MARGLDIRFITGCVPAIVFLTLAGWGFNYFILSPKAEHMQGKGRPGGKEMAARAAVRADLQLDVRPSGRVHVSGTLANGSPYDLQYVFVTVSYGVRRGTHTARVNLGAIGAGQTRQASTRLPGVRGSELDESGGIRVSVSDVRLAQ